MRIIALTYIFYCLALTAETSQQSKNQEKNVLFEIEGHNIHQQNSDNHHSVSENVKTQIVKTKIPLPYTVEKHVPYTVEKKVPYKVTVPIPQPYIVEKKVPYLIKEYVKVPYEIPQPYEVIKKVPYEVKVPVPRPYEVKVVVPKPYIVEKKVPYPVKVHVPKPYTVEKKVPYEVKVEVPVPKPYTIIKKVPYAVKVPVHRPYTVHVPKPYPVTVENRIPYPVEKTLPYEVIVPINKPYPVEIPKPITYHVNVPVPKPFVVEKKVPVQIEKPYPLEVKIPVDKPYPVYKEVPVLVKKEVPYSVKVPVYISQQINKDHKVDGIEWYNNGDGESWKIQGDENNNQKTVGKDWAEKSKEYKWRNNEFKGWVNNEEEINGKNLLTDKDEEIKNEWDNYGEKDFKANKWIQDEVQNFDEKEILNNNHKFEKWIINEDQKQNEWKNNNLSNNNKILKGWTINNPVKDANHQPIIVEWESNKADQIINKGQENHKVQTSDEIKWGSNSEAINNENKFIKENNNEWTSYDNQKLNINDWKNNNDQRVIKVWTNNENKNRHDKDKQRKEVIKVWIKSSSDAVNNEFVKENNNEWISYDNQKINLNEWKNNNDQGIIKVLKNNESKNRNAKEKKSEEVIKVWTHDEAKTHHANKDQSNIDKDWINYFEENNLINNKEHDEKKNNANKNIKVEWTNDEKQKSKGWTNNENKSHHGKVLAGKDQSKVSKEWKNYFEQNKLVNNGEIGLKKYEEWERNETQNGVKQKSGANSFGQKINGNKLSNNWSQKNGKKKWSANVKEQDSSDWTPIHGAL